MIPMMVKTSDKFFYKVFVEDHVALLLVDFFSYSSRLQKQKLLLPNLILQIFAHQIAQKPANFDLCFFRKSADVFGVYE